MHVIVQVIRQSLVSGDSPHVFKSTTSRCTWNRANIFTSIFIITTQGLIRTLQHLYIRAPRITTTMTTTTTTIDLTELGEALVRADQFSSRSPLTRHQPHDVPKILINIDDGEFEWIFAAHETINMIKVFTVHAQQYNMLPMSFCYTMSNYQLSGRETPQTVCHQTWIARRITSRCIAWSQG